jgi:hypothetical protein
MLFEPPDLHLVRTAPGTYALAPSSAMREDLARDDANMAAMIAGPIPAFDDVMSSAAELERLLVGHERRRPMQRRRQV